MVQGKSTLLKVIGGIDDDSTANVMHPNQYRIRYSSQQTGPYEIYDSS